jgi:acyl carrier protein
MTIRTVVYDQVTAVAQQQRKSLPALTDNLPMLESGLDSLCIAILIANLDDELNLTPFDSDTVEMPVTLGDLVRVYENAGA